MEPFYFFPNFVNIDFAPYLYLQNSISVATEMMKIRNLEVSTLDTTSREHTIFSEQIKKPVEVAALEQQKGPQESKESKGNQRFHRSDQRIKQQSEKDAQQYRPKAKSPQNPKKQAQNQQRNVVPNLVHQMVSFIRKSPKSQRIIRSLIQSAKVSQAGPVSVKRFRLYQKLIKQKLNYYVNVKTLDLFIYPLQMDHDIFPEAQRMFYSKVSRVLIKYFLENQLPTAILTSAKIKGSNKFLHLKSRTMFMDKIKSSPQ